MIKSEYFSLILATILVAVLWFFNSIIVPQKELVLKLANVVISINIGILGFLLTVFTLWSSDNIKSFAIIRLGSEQKKRVTNILMNATNWNAFMILPSVIILAIDKDVFVKKVLADFPDYKICFVIIGYVYVVFVFTSLIKTMRFAYLFTTLVSYQENENS